MFVLEMDVLSTVFNFWPVYEVDGLQWIGCKHYN